MGIRNHAERLYLTESTKKASPSRKRKAWSVIIRLAFLAIILVIVNLGVGALIERLADPLAESGFILNRTLLLLLMAYILLLAIPFVPGMEIGVSLLIAHGAVAAPFVYMGTLSGLTLAYGLGVLLSGPLSNKFLMFIGLSRTSAFVDEIKRLSHRQRLERMQQALPAWAGRWILRHRVLVLAALLNLPGNSVVGGGGGIALLAGLSRMFTTLQFFLTIALATVPVPLLVYFFGTGLLE